MLPKGMPPEFYARHLPGRSPGENPTAEGDRQVAAMVAIGWGRNAYAVREGCNSCPKCEHLSCYPRTDCPHCGWKVAPEVAKRFKRECAAARAAYAAGRAC